MAAAVALIVALVAAVLSWLGIVWWSARVMEKGTARLYGGDPDSFLEAVARLEPWTHRRHSRDLLSLNAAVGHFWKGAFLRALELLEGLDTGGMSRPTRAAHDACLISSLVMLDRIAEAQRVYGARRDSLRASGHPLTALMCETIEADLSLHGRGDLDEARQKCEALLRLARLPDIALASIHWTLAEIAARQQRAEAAIEHARLAVQYAGATFVAERAGMIPQGPRASDTGPSVQDRDSLVPVAVPTEPPPAMP